MCGRFNQTAKLNLLLSQFAAELAESEHRDQPRDNIAPTQLVPAVRLGENGKGSLWACAGAYGSDVTSTSHA